MFYYKNDFNTYHCININYISQKMAKQPDLILEEVLTSTNVYLTGFSISLGKIRSNAKMIDVVNPSKKFSSPVMIVTPNQSMKNTTIVWFYPYIHKGCRKYVVLKLYESGIIHINSDDIDYIKTIIMILLNTCLKQYCMKSILTAPYTEMKLVPIFKNYKFTIPDRKEFKDTFVLSLPDDTSKCITTEYRNALVMKIPISYSIYKTLIKIPVIRIISENDFTLHTEPWEYVMPLNNKNTKTKHITYTIHSYLVPTLPQITVTVSGIDYDLIVRETITYFSRYFKSK